MSNINVFLVNEIMYVFIPSKDYFLSPDKCPGTISRRRLALKLSFNCQHPLRMNDLEHSRASWRHPRRHLLIGSLCAAAQRSPLLCARIRWSPSAFVWQMHLRSAKLPLNSSVHVLSCIWRIASINNYWTTLLKVLSLMKYHKEFSI